MAGNIATYDSPISELRPTSLGTDAAQQSANRINRISTELAADTERNGNRLAQGVEGDIHAVGGAAEQYIDYQDKSKISTAAIAGRANLETALQTVLKGKGTPGQPGYVPPADPNDPTVLQKFNEEHVAPFLEDLKNIPIGERGRDYALSKADELAQHMSTQFKAEAANLEAKGAVLRSNTAANSLGQLVTTMPTPDTIDFALKNLSESIDISKSGGAMTAESAAVMDAHKQDRSVALVHAAIMSAATKSANPEATVQDLTERYKQYVKPEEQTVFLNVARTITRARTADSNAIATQQMRQEKEVAYKATSDYTQQWAANPGSVKLTDMINNPAYKNRPDLLKEAIGVVQELRTVQEKGDQVDPTQSKANSLDLMKRITADPSDPTRLTDRSAIDQAYIDRKINGADHNFLLAQQKGLETPVEKEISDSRKRFFQDNAMVLDPSLAGILKQPTVLGRQKTFEAQQEAIRQENFLRQKGEDPHSLYDPASPNYFGKQLSRFAVDAKGKLTDANSDYQIAQPQIAKAAAVIKNTLESGGNYQAISAASKDGDRAYGAYQVMGKNVGPWTKQYYGRALSPQEFMGNKEAQDMVFEGQFGKYMRQYGPEGAARAWYAGEAGMNNLGATDVYGKLTVGGYGTKFSAGYQGIPHVDKDMPVSDIVKKYAGQTVMRSDGQRWIVPGVLSVSQSK